MKSKYQQTGFHQLKTKQIFKHEGYQVDPSFLYELWIALEKWFILIAEDKKIQNKKPLLRIYDLRNDNYILKLQEIFIEIKGGIKNE